MQASKASYGDTKHSNKNNYYKTITFTITNIVRLSYPNKKFLLGQQSKINYDY